jgi:DNA-binding response OmpR family regulator
MPIRKPRILFAEDHQDTRELYAYILEQENYEVTTVEAISGALKLVAQQQFDLFVLDSRLVDGSGLDLCKRIRETDHSTPVLFCSALAFEKDKLEAFEAGAQRYLVKPVNIALLCEIIAELIAAPRLLAFPLVQIVEKNESGELPMLNAIAAS